MVKRVIVLVAVTVALWGAKSVMAQCTTINAVTSASFKITGGQACSTSASLTWTYTRNNGEMNIEWGTSTSYGTKKSIYPSSPVSLPNLTPNTTYYYHVWGIWRNATYEYTKSTFKTSGAAAPTNKPPIITTAPAVTCTTGTTRTLTLIATDADNDPVTFAISGQPNWVTLANSALTLKPVAGSANGSVRVIAQDGKGGADTLNIAITVVASTAVRAVVQKTTTGHTLSFGTDRVLFPTSGDAFVDVSLHTLAGARLLQKRVAVTGSTVELATAGVIPGVYVLQLKNSTFSLLQRVTLRE